MNPTFFGAAVDYPSFMIRMISHTSHYLKLCNYLISSPFTSNNFDIIIYFEKPYARS